MCASQKVRTLSSQVLIYHNPETFKDFSIQEPDCLGNLIATNYIITAASCFMFTFEILKYSERNDKRPTESEENAIISRSIKNIDIKKTRIVKVNVNYSVCILVRINNGNQLGFHMSRGSPLSTNSLSTIPEVVRFINSTKSANSPK